jgi:hypothetical protein
MIQLYFLSVLLNGLAGYILLSGGRTEEAHIETSLRFSPHNQTFQFILGDLVPALAGIAAGFILIFGFYREHASAVPSENEGKLDRIGETFLHYKKAMGILLLAVSALHFLFPQALFL